MRRSVTLFCFAAPSFPDKMSPIKALTMKDYENVSAMYQVASFFFFLNCYCDVVNIFLDCPTASLYNI